MSSGAALSAAGAVALATVLGRCRLPSILWRHDGDLSTNLVRHQFPAGMLIGMYPTLGVIPTHGLFLALGVLAAIGVFVVEARRRGQTHEKVVYVVLGALVGGAIFMRLGTWMQHVDLRQNASLMEQWLYGNRSILGGLVGAWIGVHVAKKIVGYRVRTGDLFAPAVALGMAIGRVGCLLTELPGTPRVVVRHHPRPGECRPSWGRTRCRAAPVVRLRDHLPRIGLPGDLAGYGIG